MIATNTDNHITTACRRRGTASARASLRLLPAPEAQRSAPDIHALYKNGRLIKQ